MMRHTPYLNDDKRVIPVSHNHGEIAMVTPDALLQSQYLKINQSANFYLIVISVLGEERRPR